MPRALSTVVAAVVATLVMVAAPTLALATDLTFVQQELGAGTSIDQKTTMDFDMDMKMTMPDGTAMPMKMAMSDIEDKTVKIVKADASGPTELQIVYRDRGATQTMFGQKSEQPSPVKGKSFTLKKKAGVVSVEPTVEGGQDELNEEFDQLDGLRAFVKNLGTSTIPVGQEVDLAALQNSGLLGATPTGPAQLERGVLKLRESRMIDGKPFGVFDIDMRMTGNDPASGMKMAMDMKGEILIDTTTGWMRSMNFGGPVTMSGSTVENGIEMKMSATGNFTMKTEATYSR